METIKVFNFTGSYVLTNLTPSTQYRIHVRSVRFTGINNETLESISSVTINTATLGMDASHFVVKYRILQIVYGGSFGVFTDQLVIAKLFQ